MVIARSPSCCGLKDHKKVERLWREEGLQLPERHKKRKRLYHKDSSVIRLRPHYPDHIWSVDFVHDKLSSGRPYKMLTVLDMYTREALCVTVRAHERERRAGGAVPPDPETGKAGIHPLG